MMKIQTICKQVLVLVLTLIGVEIKAQLIETYNSPSGKDTLTVDKTKIQVQVLDTTIKFFKLKDKIDKSVYFDSLKFQDAMGDDTLVYSYQLRYKSGISDSKYLNSILYLLDTLHIIGDCHRIFNGGKFGETGYLIVSLFNVSDTALLKSYCGYNGHTFVKLEIVGGLYLGFVKTNLTSQSFDFSEYLDATNDFQFTEPNLFYYNILTSAPNDWHYPKSWHLKNTGNNNHSSYSGSAGADINAEEAWANIYSGSCAGITVAILDDGVMANHQDLNTFQYGYNALKHDPIYSTIKPGYNRTNEYFHNNGLPDKGARHGTPCAGIACGAGNNGIGITGVAYSSTVVGIKCLGVQGIGSTISLAFGYYLAVDSANVDVISGSYAIVKTLNQYNSYIINAAIDYAIYSGRGGLGVSVFHSTGNNDANGCNPGADKVGYPASYEKVIAVTGTDVCDKLKGTGDCADGCSSPASYGYGTDIAAPYHDIWTTDNGGIVRNSLGQLVGRGYNDSNYTVFKGTSASCPMAAGVMALIYSANPFLNISQSRFIIESTADKVGSYTYTNGVANQPNGSWSLQLGYGRINAGEAVKLALKTKVKLKAMNIPGVVDLDESIIFKNNFVNFPVINVQFNDNDGKYGNYNVKWYKNGKLFYSSTTNSVAISSPGRYYATIENNCNNKSLLITETIDIRPSCNEVGYNTSMINGTTINTTVVMPTVTNTEYVPINGDLVVSTGGNLTAVNRVFIFGGSCSRVLVQNGGSFTAINCKFVGCDNWQGLISDGGGSSISLVNCSVSDATAGLISKNGGGISSTGSEFANNYLHIGAENGSVSTTVSFFANFFLDMKDLGMVLNPECSNSYYSNLSISEHQPQVYLKNMNTGDFEDNVFQVVNSYFNNNAKAIVSKNCAGLTVDDNSFSGLYETVLVCKSSNDLQISNNEFENKDEGLITNVIKDGIYCEDIQNSQILSNEIKRYRYGIQFIQNINSAILSTMQDNKFRNNNIGLVIGSEINPIGAGMSSVNLPCSTKNTIQLNIVCNLFTGNKYGVVGSGPLKTQGSLSLSAGNRFKAGGTVLNEENSFMIYNCGTLINYHRFFVNGDDDILPNMNSSILDVDGLVMNFGTNNNVSSVTTSASQTCTSLLTGPNLNINSIDDEAILVFPNPLHNGSLNITGLYSFSTITIYTIDGKKVLELLAAEDSVLVDVQDLSAGVYIIQISSGGLIHQEKLIKLDD